MQPGRPSTTSSLSGPPPGRPARRSSAASSISTLSSAGSGDSAHVADHSIRGPANGSPKTLSRPPRSPRRPTSTSSLASAGTADDRGPPARTPFGLPSPPQTSSETSGGSIRGSIRLPNSVLQPVVDEPRGEARLRGDPAAADGATSARRPSVTSSGSSDNSRGVLDDDGGRRKRLSELKERSAKIMSSLSSRPTPSPINNSFEAPISQSFAAASISSPKQRSFISSPRQSLSGEETERAYSASSQASSPFSDRGEGSPRSATNGAKKGKRVSIDSSTSGGRGDWPLVAALSSSRGHERTASLPPASSGSSDGGFSRSSGDGSNQSDSRSHHHRRAASSIDSTRSAASPAPTTPTTRRLRGTPSPGSSVALSRSGSTTSASSRGSSSLRDAPEATQTPLRSAATRVRPTSGSRRVDNRISPVPTPTLTDPRASPAYNRSTRNLGMTASPSAAALVSSHMVRELSMTSSSSSSSLSRSSAGIKPPAGQSPLVTSSTRPIQERQTSAEEVDELLGGRVSPADVGQQAPSQRERTVSTSKRRAPLPSEFTAQSAASTPSSSRAGSRQLSVERMTPSPSAASLASWSQPPSSRSGYSPALRVTPSPDTARTDRRRDSGTASAFTGPKAAEPSLRSRVLRSGEPAVELKPRYLGRGGSAESALSRKPSNSGLGGLGIEFPATTADHDDDLFSDGGSETAASRASRTRSLLQRIELENVESERRTRELREVHAIKRAESSMSLARSPTSNDGYQPATPLQRRGWAGTSTSRGGPYTGLPARPSTSMAFTNEPPRSAPPLCAARDQVLRSRRSAWNLQTAPKPSADHEGSPSPSLVRHRKLSGEPSGLREGGEGGRRTSMELRSRTSVALPSSASVRSSLSSFAGQDAQQPDHVQNMLAAFEALKRHYSRVGDHASTVDVVRAANSLISAVEQTNLSLAEATRYVREQLVAAQVEERPEVGDAEGWRVMSAVIKDAVRMNDEEVRASTGLLLATTRQFRELAVSDGGNFGGASGIIRRSETADWTHYRHAREASESSPLRSDPHARPSTSMGYATISSPSIRLRDSALTRDRLASIPSSRTLDLIDVDVPSETMTRQPPAPKENGLEPPVAHRAGGVLSHVFDRFAPRRASEDAQREPPERAWRQAKTSSASTVRAPSLYPPAPKASAATTDVSIVTARTGSPEPLPPDAEDDGYEGSPPQPPSRGFFGRTLSLASSSSPMARQASADSNSTLGRRNSTKDSPRPAFPSSAEGDIERRHSSPTTSPIASIRRLSLFGAGPRDR